MTDKIPVTGIPTQERKPINIPLRREITALANSTDRIGKIQWSLFVRALIELSAKPINDPLGYFQLAGIHSEPRVPWNGVDPRKKEFCPHESSTFPTWHRPYLVLFEQTLWKIMKESVIPALQPSRLTDWHDAADHWRLPYWDWARPQAYLGAGGLPHCFTQEQLELPNGAERLEKVPNPFWIFTNPQKRNGKPVPFDDESMGPYKLVFEKADAPYTSCSAISRYGLIKDKNESWSGFDGVNNWTAANKQLGRPAFYGLNVTDFSEAINRMFSPGAANEPKTWRQFACSRKEASDHLNFMSLEYIHNNIHNLIGGNCSTRGAGHMSEVAISSFDPIFWFHHCNIDRLTAMWQILYPQRWFDSPHEPDQPPSSSSLPPFYDSTGTFHTSDGVRDWTALGYQYDDLVPVGNSWDGNGVNKTAYSTQVRELVEALYPSTSSMISTHSYIPSLRLDDSAGFQDYVINILYDRYALGGKSYKINFYLGNTLGGSQNRGESGRYEELMGGVYTFSNDPRRCGNCANAQRKKRLSGGQVLLTTSLVERCRRDRVMRLARGFGEDVSNEDSRLLLSMEPGMVGSYLRKYLRWQFVDNDGKVRDPKGFPETRVMVLRGSIMPYQQSPSAVPEYGQYQALFDNSGRKVRTRSRGLPMEAAGAGRARL